MNFLWPIIIIISYFFAIFTGNINELNNSIFSSIPDVIKISLTLVGNMCLWGGMIKIIQSTKIINVMLKLLQPILSWLFPDAKDNKKAMEKISINAISNIIGIGNAATSAGLEAMEELQKDNKKKDTLTNSMIMLIVLNTVSIQLLPTTIMSIRASLGASNPADIIIPIWISTITGTIAGILLTKIMTWRKRN